MTEETEYFVKAKYIIGCDGSRTKVRSAANISSTGDRTEEKWVRIDGVLKHTTMPKPRAYGAIESKTYGNVLWIPLDHGATRIGFAFNEERRRMYGGAMTEEVFVKEAKESVRPFEIEYEKVDWASVYSVGQRLADTFWSFGCVFLAGDSAHTHSSGAGQGMNAGVNDAVNLGWKLAGVLKGTLRQKVLETYDSERKPNAQKLIRYDEEISMLVSGVWPKGDRYKEAKAKGEDVNDALAGVLRGAKGFNTGLTISYAENEMVWKCQGKKEGEEGIIPAPALPGWRAPDVKLLKPALCSEVWLLSLLLNRGGFHVVSFLGRGEGGREKFREFKSAVVGDPSQEQAEQTNKETNGFTNGHHMNGHEINGHHINGDKQTLLLPPMYITILPQVVDNAWHDLRTDPMGKVSYDADGSAGRRYDVDVENGSVLVIRPDGWIGARFEMGVEGGKEVNRYLSGVVA